LKECASAQLQKIGELCEKGCAVVHAMDGTIAYGIDVEKADNDMYSLDVLSVITETFDLSVNNVDQNYLTSIGNYNGLAGHVVLKYRSGGVLLLSAGHWVELSRIDVNEEVLFKVSSSYTTSYSSEYNESMTMDINSSSTAQERKKKSMTYSIKYIQSSVPCKSRSTTYKSQSLN